MARRRRVCVWIAVLISVGITVPATAQVGAGALAGSVVDQAGAAVPGATVSGIAVATDRSHTVVTGRRGEYVVPRLEPGLYRVLVELTGFRPLNRDGIRVATGETVRLDVKLEIGGVSDAVTVTADASLLRSETSGLGQVIDGRKIEGLPLNGRSFITLAGLVPSVALPPGSSLPRINGGRPRTN